MHLATSAQIRLADETQISCYATPGLLLMEHAGIEAAARIRARFPQTRKALVLVGPGNNGGDGLVVARLLHRAGWVVQVLLAQPPERFTGDAKTMWQALAQMEVNMSFWPDNQSLKSITGQAILIDALLGTGVSAALRGPVAEIIAAFRGTALPVVALDLPSGLDAATGLLVNQPIPATLTIAFQVPKVCHYVYPAAEFCGEIQVADIGISEAALAAADMCYVLADTDWAQTQLRPRRADSHKGTYGHALVVAGSEAMSGAAALSARACVRAGVGLCTVVSAEVARPVVLTHAPEAMCLAAGMSHIGQYTDLTSLIDTWLSGKKVVVAGMGMGQHPDTARWLERLLIAAKSAGISLLLDADALNLLAIHPPWWELLPANTVLTPHPGEFRRLFPEAPEGRLEAALALAQQRGVVVVLKGAGTVTAAPGGRAWVNTTGNPGMATGGSGDVLSGVIGALLAQGYPAAEAAALGVWLHGRAGDLCLPAGVTASGIADMLGECFII